MELKAGTKVTVAQDEEQSDCWYVFKDDQHGFQLRAGYDATKQPGALMMNHKKLHTLVSAGCALNPDETHNFLIAGQPTMMKGDKTKYWGLLVKSKV